MQQMTKTERVQAVLNGEQTDRVPVTVWMHFSEHDQDPRSLAEAQVEFVKKYDYDFIKLMPFGAYATQDWGARIKIYCDKYREPVVTDFGIKRASDWGNLEELPAIYGTWGKQLQAAQHIGKLVGNETPFLQTIFSPLTIALKLGGKRIFEDIEKSPGMVHSALEVITRTNINFIEANIDAGVSGFFFATQNASFDVNDEEVFEEFGEKYDLRVIDAYKERTYFNVSHIHGDNIMFDRIEKYPGNCLNWHDRYTEPSFEAARQKTEKCFLGGIREVPRLVDGVVNYDSILATRSPETIEKHIHDAIRQVHGRGLIIGPGCVADPRTKEENLFAVRRAVDTFSG